MGACIEVIELVVANPTAEQIGIELNGDEFDIDAYVQHGFVLKLAPGKLSCLKVTVLKRTYYLQMNEPNRPGFRRLPIVFVFLVGRFYRCRVARRRTLVLVRSFTGLVVLSSLSFCSVVSYPVIACRRLVYC